MDAKARFRRFIQGGIRAEKARQNLTYDDISKRLRQLGIRQSATNLSTKVGRGDMSAQLYVAILSVLGQSSISIDGLVPAFTDPAAGTKAASR